MPVTPCFLKEILPNHRDGEEMEGCGDKDLEREQIIFLKVILYSVVFKK